MATQFPGSQGKRRQRQKTERHLRNGARIRVGSAEPAGRTPAWHDDDDDAVDEFDTYPKGGIDYALAALYFRGKTIATK